MSEDLTLPATIPGLLRQCSPVRIDSDPDTGVVLALYAPGAGGASYDRAEVGIPDALHNGYPAVVRPYALPRLSLDLRCDTGRAHAAWWLGKPGCSTPRTFAHGRRRVVCLWVYAIPYIAHRGGCGRLINQGAVIVPTLADLDPDDPRLLPDGSRWVDAEALRRVALRVRGGR